MRKKRILFCSEATFLNTGYATYTREIMEYLNSTGKYELAELAAYGQRNDPRGLSLPWRYYGVQPNKEFQPRASREEMQSYDSSPFNQFGEFIFEEVCLDFKPDIVFDIRDFWMCLTPNTNIVCKNSIKKIKDIKVDDLVLTHEGRYRRVINTFKKSYFGDLHTINVQNCPFNVELTDDHPVYCLKRNGEKSLPVHKFSPKNLEWVDSQGIEKNDILVYPIDKEGDKNHKNDFCRFLGYYMAEGCIMYEGLKEDNKYKGIQLTFNANESSHIDDFISLVKVFYDKEAKIKILGNTAIVRCYGKRISQDCLKFCGSLAGDKKLSDEVFFSNNECIRSFLCGLFRGDGGYYKERASYCTKSEQLAHQVFRMCLRIGILPSFNLNKNNIKGIDKDYFRYIFSFRSNSLEGFKTIYDNLLNKEIAKATRIKNGYAWLTVKEVIKQSYGEQVHNFEVEEDNTYVSSFCIHNCEFVERSPFRKMFKWVIMPTADSAPQARQWISTYASADAVLSYSEWSGNVMKEQSGGKINYVGTAPPSANPAYKPMDQAVCRENLGLDKDIKIVGTVMRNQRRKLYPDLFEAWALFLGQQENPNEYKLYCHTSYPDLGWDIPELLQQNCVSSSVYFTYICPETNKTFASLFAGAICESPFTGKYNATMCNVKQGASYEQLSEVMNCFDLYVQYANSEGFGLPQVEAAACGIPVVSVDYSAMSSVVSNLAGVPLKPKALYKELETGCYRAVPDNEDTAMVFGRFFDIDKEDRIALGHITLDRFKKHYQWDQTGDILAKVFDSFEIEPVEKTWESAPRIHQPKPKPEIPPQTTHKQLAQWLIVNALGEPDRLNTQFESRLTRDLMYESRTSSTSKVYENESSAGFDGKVVRIPFNFDLAYREMLKIAEKRNYWEQKRI